jgi:hypothetical protein
VCGAVGLFIYIVNVTALARLAQVEQGRFLCGENSMTTVLWRFAGNGMGMF